MPDNKLFIVGIGPGNMEEMSRAAYKILKEVDVIVGYKTYLNLISDLIKEKQETYHSGMRKEKERAEKAIKLAKKGKAVAIISSGDPGVYGMAGLVFELIDEINFDIEVEVVAGITAANAAAAVLGAPLMHDYAVISLSDLLTPWKQIQKRLISAAEADFITVLYNPRSSKRTEQIKIAQEIFLESRKDNTPVGIVRNAGRKEEEKIITDLRQMLEKEIDMISTVIIGNSETYISNDRMITPRGYNL